MSKREEICPYLALSSQYHCIKNWNVAKFNCTIVQVHVCASLLCAVPPQTTEIPARLPINSTTVTKWNHTDLMEWWSQRRRLSRLSFLTSSVLSGWVKKAMVPNLSVVPMHLMSSFSVWKASNVMLCSCSLTNESRLSQRIYFCTPGLWVDGPVDDVKEDVRSREHNPRVLVYGVGVYPNVHVASGWLHLACDLRVIQRHLGQHSLLAAAVLWHPIIPCGVYVHRPVASDLGVDHHVVGVANAACTRQLEKRQKVPLSFAYCKRSVLQSHPNKLKHNCISLFIFLVNVYSFCTLRALMALAWNINRRMFVLEMLLGVRGQFGSICCSIWQMKNSNIVHKL